MSNTSEEQIRAFLYDIYGYRRIDDFVSGKNGAGISLRDFLKDTIIGTWRSSTARNPRIIILPGISKVRLTAEAENLIRSDLPYHISNLSFFMWWDNSRMDKFIEERVRPSFPNARINVKRGPKRSSTWNYHVQTKEFSFYVQGASAPGSKVLDVDFDTPPNLPTELNNIVARYYFLKRKIEDRYHSNDKEQELMIDEL